MGLSIGMKEWSAVVQALGTGQQTLMLRGYPSKHAEFLLYPTFSFYTSTKSLPGVFENRFQSKYVDMAKEAGETTAARAREFYVDIEYWAELDELFAVEKDNLRDLSKHFMWSLDHIEDYEAKCRQGLFIWLVRVHRLPKPIAVGRIASGGVPNIYRHPDEISTVGSTPVLPDEDFKVQKDSILLKSGYRAKKK